MTLGVVRVPVCRQRSDQPECGLACLVMVAGHYGHAIDLKDLSGRVPVTDRGITAQELAVAARDLGFVAAGVRASTIGDLAEVDLLPAIAHWGGDHFVVLEEAQGDDVWIVDPRFGRCRLDRAQADRRFTGTAVLIGPALG